MVNKIALITGATSGIGEAYAKKLASQNYDLIITGRREEKIKQLAAKLMAQYKINVEVMLIELAKKDELEMLLQKVASIKNLDILINNAGFTVPTYFAKESLLISESILNVHVLATIKLTHTALSNMIANNSGTIINVSSIGAFYAFVTGAMYVGTKSCVNLFTESLYLELKEMRTNVRVQVLCPGMTISDFHPKIKPGLDAKKIAASRGFLWKAMTADEVVKISLRYLEKDKVICVPGFRNKVLVWIATLKRLISL